MARNKEALQANTANAQYNKFLFDHVSSQGVGNDAEFARRLGITRTRVSALRTGRTPVGSKFLLRVLQEFPPTSWEEFHVLGMSWYPGYKQRLRDRGKKVSAGIPKNPIAPINEDFFEFMHRSGLTMDGDIARALHVSHQLISQLRKGSLPVSERLYERVNKLKGA